MKTEVSIVIPVFNKADYLADCLDSVLGQTFRDFEVICVDDASEDDCATILQDYEKRDHRVKVISNRKNLGPAESRNKGIEAANGNFLRFLDADDLLPENSTEVLFSRAVKDDADLVRGSLALFRGNDLSAYQQVISVPDKTRTQLPDEETLWIPWWHTSYLISAKMVRRNHLRYPKLVRGEDPVFLASVLVSAAYISLVEDIVYLYRKYNKDSGSAGSTMKHVVDTLRHAAMTKRLFMDHCPDCWQHGYGPYLLDDVLGLVGRFKYSSDQKRIIDIELKNIWGEDALTARKEIFDQDPVHYSD